MKKHEDFVTTMDANEDKIINAIEGGQRLVDSGNLYLPKVKDKIDSIRDRFERFNNICANYSCHNLCSRFTDIILSLNCVWLLFHPCYLTILILIFPILTQII